MHKEFTKIKEKIMTVEPLFDVEPSMENIFSFIIETNKKKDALTFKNDKGKYTTYKYVDLYQHALNIASVISFKLSNTKINTPIILKANNSPSWVEIFWAILMTGHKPLLINAKTNKDGTDNLIKQGRAVAIITDDSYSYDIPKLTVGDVTNTIFDKKTDFVPTWENEVIFCSSGTTGDIKLMIFNGENIMNQVFASLEMPETSKDIVIHEKEGKMKILAMIPFHHIFGFVAIFLWYLVYGAEIVFVSSNAPSEIQLTCQEVGITHVYSVPLFWDSLAQGLMRKKALESPQNQEYIDKLIAYNTGKIPASEAGPYKITEKLIQKNLLGTEVCHCISGGGYLDQKTQIIINGIGYPLYNGYGMTEIGVTSVELSHDVTTRLKGSIGIPLHGIEYKINAKNGSKTGELLVKSKITHIREIIGGVEQPCTLDSQEYFATGDIAEKDETGRYFIKGRIKDIIINSDGENIFPDELEIFFKNVKFVTQVCVLGINKKNSTNQDICCVVEVDNHISNDELESLKAELKSIGNEKLTKGTKITHFYFAMKKMPTANNMKVKRFEVKKAIESDSKDYVSLDYKQEEKIAKVFDKKTIEEIYNPTLNIFSKILILPTFKINGDSHWINDLGGDSMSYVELLTEVQNKFDVTIPEEKYGKLENLNDFVEEIANLKKNK